MSVLRPWSINRKSHISSRQSCTVCSHSVYQWFPVDLGSLGSLGTTAIHSTYTHINKHNGLDSSLRILHWLPHRRFQLCFSQENSLFVLAVVLSCSLSSRDFLVEWKPDSLSVNPLIASRCYTLAAGGSWKAQSQMEGGGFAHRGRHASWGVGVGVGFGVIHLSILSALPAALVKDYYPRCISTTALLIPLCCSS